MTEIKELIMDKPGYKFFCEICNSGFNRKSHYDVHLKTNKHVRNERQGTNVSTSTIIGTTTTDKTREYLDMIELLRKNIKMSEEQVISCNQHITDKSCIIEQLKSHVDEQKVHIDILKKTHLTEQLEKDNVIQDLKNKLDSRNTKDLKNNTLIEENNRICKDLDDAHKQIEDLSKKNELADNTIIAHMKSYDQMRELCDTMMPRINEYGKLKNEYEKTLKEKYQLNDSNIKLQDENNKIKKYGHQIMNIERIQQENERLMKDNKNFKVILKSMENVDDIKKENAALKLQNTELVNKYKEGLIQKRVFENRLREVEYNQRRSQKRTSYDSEDDGWN